jgi:hypothetical protein
VDISNINAMFFSQLTGRWFALSCILPASERSESQLGALYLEHIPQSHQVCLSSLALPPTKIRGLIISRFFSWQWTLTLLSAWWAVGQLVASVIAWGFIGNFSCSTDTPVGQCHKADNMGWRYTLYVA